MSWPCQDSPREQTLLCAMTRSLLASHPTEMCQCALWSFTMWKEVTGEQGRTKPIQRTWLGAQSSWSTGWASGGHISNRLPRSQGLLISEDCISMEQSAYSCPLSIPDTQKPTQGNIDAGTTAGLKSPMSKQATSSPQFMSLSLAHEATSAGRRNYSPIAPPIAWWRKLRGLTVLKLW